MINYRHFFLQLSLFSIGVAALIFILNTLTLFRTYQDLSWLSWGFFVLLSIIIYALGRAAVLSPDKTLFNSVLTVFMGGKMILSVALIFTYRYLVEPETKIFIIPFFLIYVLYTGFEIYVLTKLAKH